MLIAKLSCHLYFTAVRKKNMPFVHFIICILQINKRNSFILTIPVSIISLSDGILHIASIFSCVFRELEIQHVCSKIV